MAQPDRDAVAPDRLSAAASLPDRIAFLGFGLIGGSIAMALREAGAMARLVAWTPSGNGPAEGLRRSIVDAAPRNPAAALDGAGLVILAGPPLSVLDHLEHLSGPMRSALAPGATITDVASTKARIVSTAEGLGLPFVGGHPMAGRETTGVESATAELFIDRPWVVTRPSAGAAPGAMAVVESLARAVGARPITMDPGAHDAAVAAISHLPLVAAAALVESVTSDVAGWASARPLAASGWRDMTRLARGDVDMGAGILATNAGPIARQLRAYRDAIDAWIAALDDADAGRLRDRLRSARDSLDGGAT